jgi:porin
MTAMMAGAIFPAPSLAQTWSDEKDRLAMAGITPVITYDGDLASNVDGGVRRGSVFVGNLHVQLKLDVERWLSRPGVTVFLDGLWIHGGQPSALVGDAQGVSNIAAPSAIKLYEAWIQYNSADSRFSVLAGRYDLNSEFYRLTSAGLFLNSSFGIGPEFGLSGVAGPSVFPDTSLGVRFTYKPGSDVVLRTAVLDGVPVGVRNDAPSVHSSGDGVLLVSEVALLGRPGPATAPGKMRSRIGRVSALPPYEDKWALGGWYYTAAFDDLSEVDASGEAVRRQGSGGAYVLVDHTLYRDADDWGRHVSGFFQGGVADGRTNRFGSYVGVGAFAGGVIPGRASDEIGVAAAIGRNGSHNIRAQERLGVPVDETEIAIEMTWLAQVTGWLAVQPDVQYVVHPGTDARVRNAVVVQVQFEASF